MLFRSASVFSLWKKRIPWLLILMISAAFTGAIISHYEKALAAYVILTTFIPMFMDTAGNAGNQTSVTVIRSIALGEIDFKDYFKILRKEFSVAFFCGLTLAAANFLKIILIDHVSMTIAFVVCITLLITVICAKVVGCSLPMVAKKLGADPAVMATPFITTIVDGIALVVFFQIATMMLGI